MSFLKNIGTVARIESKTLMRSWFLRIFAIIALLVIFVFNIAISQQEFSPRIFRGLPTNIPYATLLIFNVIQAAIAVFLATDFMKRDKKQDTTEVIYVRSISNSTYIWGKVYGNLRVFLGLNLIILVIPLIFTLVTKDMTFDPLGYGLYFMLISVPTLLFIFGLSFFMMSWIRNQAVVLLVLLGYIALTLFYLNDKLYYIFDYMSFNIPMIWSEFVGLPDPDRLILHKVLYGSLGIALVFFTILLMKRLRQSNLSYWGSLGGGLLFLGIASALAVNHVKQEVAMRNLRSDLIQLNDQYLKTHTVSVNNYHLTVHHKGARVAVTAEMIVHNPNPQPLDTLVFSLNPGFTTEQCLVDNQDYEFDHQKHLLLIEKKLSPGDTSRIVVRYAGKPDERVCYLDVPDRILFRGEHMTLFRLPKKFSFLTPDYLMFTPELLWYPVPGTGFSVKNVAGFRKNFARYELEVQTHPRLTVLSQGEGEKSGNQWHFSPSQPLTCLSLIAGDYQRDSLSVDGITYNIYCKPGHDYYKPFFSEIQDTIPALVESVMGDYESQIHLDYPYEEFSIVEVPAHFYAYKKNFTLASEASLPQMVLMQERAYTLNGADFTRVTKRFNRRREGEQTPQEMKADAFRRFIRSNFIEGEDFSRLWGSENQLTGNTKIFPNFVSYSNDFGLPQLPVMNPVLERYIDGRGEEEERRGFRGSRDLDEEERANLLLQENSFAELMSDTAHFVRLSDVIDVKGDYFISLMKHFAGPERFDPMLDSFITATRYHNNTGQLFLDHIKNQHQINTEKYMQDWLYSRDLPAFIFRDIEGFTFYDEEQIRYQAEATITNTGNVRGLVKLNMRMGRRRNSSFSEEKTVLLDAGVTKRVGITVGEAPSVLNANTLVSSNLPAVLGFPLRDVEDKEKEEGGAFTRVVEKPDPGSETIIVDNEDSAFRFISPERSTKLRDLIQKQQESDEYSGLNFWRPPDDWQKVIHNSFYGDVKLSAGYIMSGQGEHKAVWMVPLKNAGYYEVQAYISDAGLGPRWRRRDNNRKIQYHYTVFHDEGEETISVEVEDNQGDWVSLGTFYFSPDSARIQISNQTKGRVVVADAVKLIRK
ncbi:MAG TPA: hypothetical protein VJ876_07870 [Bacteroidales bacterium]|nr:hypothetical protein [Bacteroidales bacterium]